MPKKQRIIMIAGPNGAGKTTFAREYLLKEAHCPDFINVDLIAAGLSPFAPDRAAIQAGRLMLSEIQRRVRKRESFAFETTLSGHGYARMIPEWRLDGYRVRLVFLGLPDPEMAVARVAMRVKQGGHDVDQTVIRRRFGAGLDNLKDVYMQMVDKWEWYDSSGNTPYSISEARNRRSPIVRRNGSISPEARDTLRALRRAARRALELGIQMGTPVYVWKNGKIVDLTKVHGSAKKSKSRRSPK